MPEAKTGYAQVNFDGKITPRSFKAMPEAKTGYAQVNGAELYYEVTGEGSTLVFVHAGICDMRMWDD